MEMGVNACAKQNCEPGSKQNLKEVEVPVLKVLLGQLCLCQKGQAPRLSL